MHKTEQQVTEALEEPPKRRGRPPGSKNTSRGKSKPIPWFKIWRGAFWAIIALVSIVSLYRGINGWLGQSIAYVALSVSVLVAAFLLDRDWKKMRV